MCLLDTFIDDFPPMIVLAFPLVAEMRATSVRKCKGEAWKVTESCSFMSCFAMFTNMCLILIKNCSEHKFLLNFCLCFTLMSRCIYSFFFLVGTNTVLLFIYLFIAINIMVMMMIYYDYYTFQVRSQYVLRSVADACRWRQRDAGRSFAFWTREGATALLSVNLQLDVDK